MTGEVRTQQGYVLEEALKVLEEALKVLEGAPRVLEEFLTLIHIREQAGWIFQDVTFCLGGSIPSNSMATFDFDETNRIIFTS